jgi:hypothetical protein
MGVVRASLKGSGPPGCAVVTAEFYNFEQRCGWPSVTTIDHDGEEWPVCARHAPPLSASEQEGQK